MKKLRLCIRMMGGVNWIGGSLYTQNLIRALAILPANERNGFSLALLAPQSGQDLIETVRGVVDEVHVESLWNRLLRRLSTSLLARYPSAHSRKRSLPHYDFVYPEVPAPNLPHLWGGWIPDFQHRRLPDLFPRKELLKREQFYKNIVTNAPIIILSSRTAQDDLCQYYPEAFLRSRVMNFASFIEPDVYTGNPDDIQQKYGLAKRFFIVCNQFWKHKNHVLVIEALGLLRAEGIKPQVVFTGSLTDHRDPHHLSRLNTRILELDIADQIRILGFIPRFEQLQLMRKCIGVIQPSIFEGWSTVVEDARALGKFVLLSDLDVHREQDLPNSVLFDPKDPLRLSTLIRDAYYDLNSGPDAHAEHLSRQENSTRLLAQGRRFVEIVAETISIGLRLS